jgi:uridine kinase
MSLHSTLHGRVFLLVLLVKLLVVCFYTPVLYTEWWLPFLHTFVESGFGNPWDAFSQSGGTPKAFPYGTGMLLVLSTPIAVKSLVFGLSAIPTASDAALVGLPILLADLGMLTALVVGFKLKADRSVYIYWCSPVVFYISYIHGQLDLLPMSFLVLGIVLVSRSTYLAAGVVLGIAVATKENIVVSVPFLMIYAARKSGLPDFARYAASAGLTYLALLSPVFFSDGYQLMVLAAEERTWIYASTLHFGGDSILLIPFVLGIIFLSYSALDRLNIEVCTMYIGLAFTALLLLVPGTAPGWYAWLIPFFCYYSVRSYGFRFVSIALFSTFYLAFFLTRAAHEYQFFDPEYLPPLGQLLGARWGSENLDNFSSAIFSLLQATILYIAFLMYTKGVRMNDAHSATQTPLVIGVGGDSGAGKDTFCNAAIAMLGSANTREASGDDYHKWERGDASWAEFTHLDPKANDLHRQFLQIRSLRQGSMVVGSRYDHSDGKFSAERSFEAKKYILVHGLHLFYTKSTRGLIDLKVFLEPEEALRVDWKVTRDRAERGHAREAVLAAIADRAADSKRYIAPQKQFADLAVRYEYTNRPNPDLLSSDQLQLVLTVDNSVNLLDIPRVLSGVDSLEVFHEFQGTEVQYLRARGTIEPYRLMEAARKLIPDLSYLLDRGAIFEKDLQGISQLVLLCMISHKELERRDGAGR